MLVELHRSLREAGLLGAVRSLHSVQSALGRQEDWEDSPEGYPQTATHPEWWRLPDEYGDSTG